MGEYSDSEDSESTGSSDFDHREWVRKKTARMLEKERMKLIAQWKAEAMKEAQLAREEEEANRWHRRISRSLETRFTTYLGKAFRFLSLLEGFICNMPLTIGAVALAIVS
jgi:hypothetical protein